MGDGIKLYIIIFLCKFLDLFWGGWLVYLIFIFRDIERKLGVWDI